MELSTGWHEAIVSGTIAAAWVFALVGGYLSGISLNIIIIIIKCVTIIKENCSWLNKIGLEGNL